MKTGTLGFTLIKASEVFVPYVYADGDTVWPRRRVRWQTNAWVYPDGSPIAGTPTYGYGFIAHTQFDCPADMREEDAAAKLALRLPDYEAAVVRAWSVHFAGRPDPNQNQFDALADFAWNEGTEAVRQLIEHLSTAVIDFSDTAAGDGIVTFDREKVTALFVAWDKWTVNGRLIENTGLKTRRLREVALFFRPVEMAWGPEGIARIMKEIYDSADAQTEEFRDGSSVTGDDDPH